MASHRWHRHRKALDAAWITALAVLGFASSTSLPQARALGVPTITVPGITTVTPPALPTTPITTAATTVTGAQTSASTPTTTAVDLPTQAARTPDAGSHDAVVAGMIRLSGGGVSIPVTSVRMPARLRILLSVAPRTIARPTQPVAVTARIVDTRGYVVRGARVVVSAGRRGMLRGTGSRLSSIVGLASFVVRNRVPIGNAASLVILVQAFDPAARKATVTSQRVRVVLRVSG